MLNVADSWSWAMPWWRYATGGGVVVRMREWSPAVTGNVFERVVVVVLV